VRSRSPLVPVLVVLLPIFLVAGIWLGGHPGSLPGPVRDVFVDTDQRALDEGLGIIERDYYRHIGRRELVNRSLSGAVRSLGDRFSHYFDPKAYAAFQRTSSGQFSGVGIDVVPDRRGLRILDVFPGSPARRAGLVRGDLVVAADGKSLAGKSTDVASSLIQGKPGTKVTLTYVTGGHRRTQRITRARIDVPSVTVRTARAGGATVAYARLADFVNGSSDELRQAVTARVAHGAKAVVLDLRGNGGGLLDEAVKVASIFIPEGPVVITDGRTRPRHVYKATGDAISTKVPVVVLVDRNTASAAEIVAGALQDRHRAKVVGTRTFGKGVFQEIEPLDNGGALDITVGEYFTPSGKNLGGGGTKPGAGLQPDLAVNQPPRRHADPALAAALRLLARDVKRGK
jgi:carboxyl-terminal processing protease